MNINVLENLAKLSFTEEERAEAEIQMSSYIESFRKLEEFDTSEAEALVQVTTLKNVLREDIAVKNISREVLLSNAPQHDIGHFQVPKTIE